MQALPKGAGGIAFLRQSPALPLRTHSCAFGYQERDVIRLFVRAELPDLGRDRFKQLL